MSPSEHIREAEDVIVGNLRSLGRNPDPAVLTSTLDGCRAQLDRVQRVYETGSPEAIADCRLRLKDAQRRGQHVIDALDTDPRFRPMTPEEARAAREEAPLEEPVEYETDSEGDEQ